MPSKLLNKYYTIRKYERVLTIMNEILLALLAGFIVGVIFTAVKLPLPAPPVLAGIAGIVGIYLGGVSYRWIIERFVQ